MAVYDITSAKIRQLPKSLAEKVSALIDFLTMRHDTLVNGDFCNYLILRIYENRLEHGEIKWRQFRAVM
jgi:hypothetical protein